MLQYAILQDVNEALTEIESFGGTPDEFQLALSEQMLDPVGVNMAIITDAVLARGWTVNGYHQMDGYRIFRYKGSD